jgi:hypothetical protein
MSFSGNIGLQSARSSSHLYSRPPADEEFPFQWMTDDFSASGPSSALWTWSSCMVRTPPYSWDDLGITGSAAFLMANNSACYISPANAASTWVLPLGTIQGAAVRVSMRAGPFIPAMPNYLAVPCCHNVTTQVGIEYGVRDVSLANFHLGEYEDRICGCALGYDGKCYPRYYKSYDSWSVGSSIRVPKGNYWWQETTNDPRSYCSGRPYPAANCDSAGCSTVTTIKTIPGVPGQVTVEVPSMSTGGTLPPTNVSTSVVTLALTAARRFQFLRFGSGRSTPLGGVFSSVPWLLGMQDVAIYLPGQCYDNNVANGDGCSSNNFVEPMCRCAPDTNKFKFSICSCPTAANLLTTSGITFGPSSFVNPNTEIVVSGASTLNRTMAYSKRTTFVLQNCPHSNLNCTDTRIARYLRLSINGTWQAPVQPVFRSCDEAVCGPGRYIIDLAGLFAPFEYGTQLQFVWWMNVKPGFAGGMLDQNGSVFAASPRITLNKLVPRVSIVGYNFYITGFAADVTFASNVRDPETIEVFMYEGTAWGAPALTNISATDPYLTSLDGNCTTSVFGDPIRHFCTVQIPAPRFPNNNLYLVARVTHGQIVGDIAPINATVGANSFSSWIIEPVIAQDTTKTSLTFEASGIRSDMDIKLYVGDVLVPSTERGRNRTQITFDLIIPSSSDHFAFPSAGPLIISYADGYNQINSTIAMVFPSTLSQPAPTF